MAYFSIFNKNTSQINSNEHEVSSHISTTVSTTAINNTNITDITTTVTVLKKGNINDLGTLDTGPVQPILSVTVSIIVLF